MFSRNCQEERMRSGEGNRTTSPKELVKSLQCYVSKLPTMSEDFGKREWANVIAWPPGNRTISPKELVKSLQCYVSKLPTMSEDFGKRERRVVKEEMSLTTCVAARGGGVASVNDWKCQPPCGVVMETSRCCQVTPGCGYNQFP
uniref:Uncharacterized protein n=1 Tax=Timema cristinae TaxID=61476 RepID=A0A7R9D8R0_TIMCR|nr:unnamed protein product [Timema cristinae]